MSISIDSSLLLIPGFSTAFLHGIMGALTAFLTLTFFISYKIKGNAVSKKLALFFLFFTLYSSTVTSSILLFPGNMQTAGWGIIIGLYFILLVILMGFDTPLFYKHPLFEKHAKYIRLVFASLWGFFSIYGVVFLQDPHVGEGNFLYWNMTPVCGYGLTFLCFWAAFGWGYIYSKSAQYVGKEDLETYIKTRTFAIDGFLWAIAGPSYIAAPNFWAIALAFIIMIATFLATAGVFSYYRFFGRGIPHESLAV